MKEHVTLNSCRHIGIQPAIAGFGNTPVYGYYCVRQFKCPDDIHKGLDCKNCPDFEPYEYDIETTSSVKWEGSDI
jgi:hypothetical protein